MLQLMAVLAARDSWRQQALLLVVVVLPEPLVLLALLLLLADCSVEAVAVAAEVLVVLVAQVVLEVVDLVAVGVRVVAAHTQQVLVVLAVMAGHWYWSFDHAAICSC